MARTPPPLSTRLTILGLIHVKPSFPLSPE